MVVLVNSAGWRYENRRCNLYGQPSFSLSPEALMAPLGIRRRRRRRCRRCLRCAYVTSFLLSVVSDETLIINASRISGIILA